MNDKFVLNILNILKVPDFSLNFAPQLSPRLTDTKWDWLALELALALTGRTNLAYPPQSSLKAERQGKEYCLCPCKITVP